jgi:hypothetical protein
LFVGLGLAGGGVATSLALRDANAELRGLAASQAVFDPSIEARRDHNLTSTVALFSVGGALAVAGAGLLGRGLIERRLLAGSAEPR